MRWLLLAVVLAGCGCPVVDNGLKAKPVVPRLTVESLPDHIEGSWKGTLWERR